MPNLVVVTALHFLQFQNRSFPFTIGLPSITWWHLWQTPVEGIMSCCCKKRYCWPTVVNCQPLARCWENLYYTCLWIICLDVVWITMKYDPKHNVILYYTQNPCNPPHLLPFGQCIVEQTTLPLLNSLIVYCRVSSNFHFSLSIILFLVQKYWSIKKISRGGWSGFGKALVWIDPNCHENCLDWSKLFSSLSKLHPNRRCSVILPWMESQ